MKSKSVFLKELAKFSLPTVVGAIISLLVIPLISRICPTEEYGRISNFYSFGNMLMLISMLGIDNAFIRFFNNELPSLKKENLFRLSLFISLLTDLFFSTILYLTIPTTISKRLFDVDSIIPLLLLSVYVFSSAVLRMTSNARRLNIDSKSYNIQQILYLFINRLCYAIPLIFGFNYLFSIVLMTLGTTVLASVSLYKEHRILREVKIYIPQKSDVLQLIFFSFPALASTVILWINNSLAKLILGATRDFGQVGIFSMAISISNIFAVIPSAFNVYWSAFFYKNYRTDNQFIKSVHNYILLCCIVIITAITLFQDLLFRFIGVNYASSQPYFLLIMLAPIKNLLTETTSYGINISNNTYHHLIASLLSCGTNALISITLINKIGAYGAALGVFGSAIVGLIYSTVVGQHYYKSILDARVTALSYITIFALCIANVIGYRLVYIRVLVLLLSIAFCLLVFKNEINSIVQRVKQSMHRGS